MTLLSNFAELLFIWCISKFKILEYLWFKMKKFWNTLKKYYYCYSKIIVRYPLSTAVMKQSCDQKMYYNNIWIYYWEQFKNLTYLSVVILPHYHQEPCKDQYSHLLVETWSLLHQNWISIQHSRFQKSCVIQTDSRDHKLRKNSIINFLMRNQLDEEKQKVVFSPILHIPLPKLSKACRTFCVWF